MKVRGVAPCVPLTEGDPMSTFHHKLRREGGAWQEQLFSKKGGFIALPQAAPICADLENCLNNNNKNNEIK